jgi:hypothetical protein
MSSESWRDAAAYQYLEGLSPSALAWEFLRRNEDYQQAYLTHLKGGAPDVEPAAEARLAHAWGLSFFRRPGALRPAAAGVLAA